MGGFERDYGQDHNLISVSPCAGVSDRECSYPLMRGNYTEQRADLSE